ncbi:MAG TPA: hypothetical protein VI756_28425 [Blastocatellia bacterium]
MSVSKNNDLNPSPPLKGIRFVTDSEGNRVAVMLDLSEWGELWEDIYDNLMADHRAGESTATLEEFRKELSAEGLLNE